MSGRAWGWLGALFVLSSCGGQVGPPPPPAAVDDPGESTSIVPQLRPPWLDAERLPRPLPDNRFKLPPLQTSLQTYELRIPQSALDVFAADPYAPEHPATFIHGGTEYPVKVRL